MGTSFSSRRGGIIKRLFPVVYCDEHFFALDKPARIDLEASLQPRRASCIDLIARGAGLVSDEAGESPIPLILPERFASGVALFARSEEAAHRIAGMSASGKLRFVHTAVVKGKPPRAKITVKPGGRQPKPGGPKSKPDAPPAKSGGESPRPTASATPSARIEIVASQSDRHIARCDTAASGFDDVRRCYKAAGLSIVGDERPTPQRTQSANRPARQPLIHLEELAFPHPFTGKTVVLKAPAPRGFKGHIAQAPPPEEHLQVALARRIGCLLDERTNAFRLFTGREEGISGLAADVLNDVVIIETLQGKFHEADMQLNRVANFYHRTLGVPNVVAQRIPKRRDTDSGNSTTGAPVAAVKGSIPDETIVTESGLKFIVAPSQGMAAGLFLDQRDNRRRIMELATGKRVLNLFAYTCGFSVAAAAGGAASTTSVDLAARHLDWGRRNFAANDIALDDHTFIRDDSFEYLKRAKRQGKSFDIIVLDPPSFSRSKKPKRTFEIRRNLVELIAAAADVLDPGGHLLVCTNFRQVTQNWLVGQVAEAAGNRSHRVAARCKLPVDFAADPDYQKSILVRFG